MNGDFNYNNSCNEFISRAGNSKYKKKEMVFCFNIDNNYKQNILCKFKLFLFCLK